MESILRGNIGWPHARLDNIGYGFNGVGAVGV